MTVPSQIDTSNLLTILGVIAAVWALISPTKRLRLRFCIAWWDWVVGGAVFILIHYLVFAPTLKQLGLYYSLGPWKWGLDSSSAVYLLLLFVAIYFFWRTRTPVLARGKAHILHELIENLHFTKRYDELVLLVDSQLPKLIRLTKQNPGLVRLNDRINPPIDIATLLSGDTSKAQKLWRKHISSSLQYLKYRCLARDNDRIKSHEIISNLVTSPDLTVHLALAHPHFCLKLLETDEAIRSDFIENYIDALLNAPGSRLYVELKNNQNLNGGNRLLLPENNRLLRFLFANAAWAINNGLDTAIGTVVCRRLDEDTKLADKLNESLGSYYDAGRFRCPINSGITLFEIMVHEGIHQGLQDHMWLHYFGHFSEKILKRMPVSAEEDAYSEWPTPFHYLIYRLISVATDWSEQCSRISDSEIPEDTRISENFDRHYISKQATIVLGTMLEQIVQSKKLSASFKTYLLAIVLRSFIKLERAPNLADVAKSLITNVIIGSNLPTKASYRLELWDLLDKIDHVLRHNASNFEQALSASLE